MNRPSANPATGTIASALKDLFRQPLTWLLVAVPVAIALRLAAVSPLALFLVSCIAVIPLAGLMGRATENLAAALGPAIGGLLNATFGNAAELIIALVALSKAGDHPEMFDLVKASLTGSIIGNVLLVLGLSIMAGGFRYPKQTFNRTAASMGATLMALATIGLILPAVYFEIARRQPQAETARGIETLSEEIAAILAVTYLLSLVYTLRTHRQLHEGGEEKPEPPEWGRGLALTVLVIATVGVAVMSEFLVGSVEEAAHGLGMNEIFVGVIVVAVIGNAAEHSTAVLAALKNKMDLALSVAVGSSLQIALFVAPVLIFASVLMGHPHPLDLHFSRMEVAAVVIALGAFALVSQDGETHWMEGVMLLAVYAMLALAFYHLPDGAKAP
jgi:Ca2+:H+ antiporter